MSDGIFIEYESTVDDIIEFNKHHWLHSPSRRGFNQKLRSFIVVAMLVSFTVIAIVRQNPAMIVGGLGGIGIFLLLHRWLPGISMGSLVRAASLPKGKLDGLTGLRRLTLTDEFLEESSHSGRLQTRYAALLRFEDNEDFDFIYINSLAAHAVPKQRIIAGDYFDFMQELRSRFEAAHRDPITDRGSA